MGVGLACDEWPAAPTGCVHSYRVQRQHGILKPTRIVSHRRAKDIAPFGRSATDVVLSWPERDDDAELREPLLSPWPVIERESLLLQLVAARELQFAQRPTT